MLKQLLSATAMVTIASVSYAATPASPAPAATTSSTVNSGPAFVTAATANEHLASKLIGADVYESTAANAQSIGKVNDILIGDNGAINAVVVGVGGFLGVGQKNVALAYPSLQWTERNGNPMGFSANDRTKFIEKQGFPIYDGTQEYCLWMGCMGSYDPQGREIVTSFTKVLDHLGITYGVLKKERCTGDSARRLGNDLVFQQLAEQLYYGPWVAERTVAVEGVNPEHINPVVRGIVENGQKYSACDAYNAMTTDRSYRAKLSHADAIAELRRCAGTQFDPVVVAALLAVVGSGPEPADRGDAPAPAAAPAVTSP